MMTTPTQNLFYLGFYKIAWRKKDGNLTDCHLSSQFNQSPNTLCGVKIREEGDLPYPIEGFLTYGSPCSRCWTIAKNDHDDEIANRHLNDMGHF